MRGDEVIKKKGLDQIVRLICKEMSYQLILDFN